MPMGFNALTYYVTILPVDTYGYNSSTNGTVEFLLTHVLVLLSRKKKKHTVFKKNRTHDFRTIKLIPGSGYARLPTTH